METEPNDGEAADLSDVDQLVVGGAVSGAIGTAGDVDVFFFDTEPGQLYGLTLLPADQSDLAAHLIAAARDSRLTVQEITGHAVAHSNEEPTDMALDLTHHITRRDALRIAAPEPRPEILEPVPTEG